MNLSSQLSGPDEAVAAAAVPAAAAPVVGDKMRQAYRIAIRISSEKSMIKNELLSALLLLVVNIFMNSWECQQRSTKIGLYVSPIGVNVQMFFWHICYLQYYFFICLMILYSPRRETWEIRERSFIRIRATKMLLSSFTVSHVQPFEWANVCS